MGLNPSPRAGEILRNRFGQSFRLAAEQIKGRFKHDGFDTSVIEIEKEDVEHFINQLHFTMDA